MSMKSIRKLYGVPAKRGGRIRFRSSTIGDKIGTIVGSRDNRLRVRFDGQNMTRILHPDWMVEYLTH